MEKLKQYKYIILIVVIILGLAFYWYEWRPTQIRKECAESALKDAPGGDWRVRAGLNPKILGLDEKVYRACLIQKGLEK